MYVTQVLQLFSSNLYNLLSPFSYIFYVHCFLEYSNMKDVEKKFPNMCCHLLTFNTITSPVHKLYEGFRAQVV